MNAVSQQYILMIRMDLITSDIAFTRWSVILRIFVLLKQKWTGIFFIRRTFSWHQQTARGQGDGWTTVEGVTERECIRLQWMQCTWHNARRPLEQPAFVEALPERVHYVSLDDSVWIDGDIWWIHRSLIYNIPKCDWRTGVPVQLYWHRLLINSSFPPSCSGSSLDSTGEESSNAPIRDFSTTARLLYFTIN